MVVVAAAAPAEAVVALWCYLAASWKVLRWQTTAARGKERHTPFTRDAQTGTRRIITPTIAGIATDTRNRRYEGAGIAL